MPLPRSHQESLHRQLHIHEERLELLHWQLGRLQAHDNETPARAGSKELGASLRQKAIKAAHDPNPKVRSPGWVARHSEAIQREIQVHERLLELGRDPKVLDALGVLAEDRAYASEAAKNPKAAAKARGIELPAAMLLRVDVEADRVRLRIDYYEAHFPFSLTWTSDGGFSAPREPSSARKAPPTAASQRAGDP
jgi:hypothetical protein